MTVAELKQAVFADATECARTGNPVEVRQASEVPTGAFEEAFAEWQMLGGRNVDMALDQDQQGLIARFTRPEQSSELTLADTLARRLPGAGSGS